MLFSIETSLKFVHKDPMNNMPVFLQLASMGFKCIFFFQLMITNKISTEMSLQGNLPFYECPHTLALSISWLYIQTQFTYQSINQQFTYQSINRLVDWLNLIILIYIFRLEN